MYIHPSDLKAGDVFIVSFNAAPITCIENYIEDREGLTALIVNQITWLSLVGVTKVELITQKAFDEVLSIK